MSKYTFHPEDLAQWLRECDIDDSKADLLWNRMKQFYDSVQEPNKKKWDFSITCEDDEVEGIYGPFEGYALIGKTSIGSRRNIGKFATLSEAVMVGRNIEDCVGITKGANGYDLRSREELVPVKKEFYKDHVKSWTFNNKKLEDLIK